MLDYDKGLISVEIETRVAKVQFHSQSKKKGWTIVRKKCDRLDRDNSSITVSTVVYLVLYSYKTTYCLYLLIKVRIKCLFFICTCLTKYLNCVS